FQLSREVLEEATKAIERQAGISFDAQSDSIIDLQRAYVRVRRLRDEFQNLLSDIQDLRRIGDEPSFTPYFIVPHMNLFDAYIDYTDPTAKSAELPRFLFGMRKTADDANESIVEKIRIQIGDVFRVRARDGDPVLHRNVLLKENFEDFRDLR